MSGKMSIYIADGDHLLSETYKNLLASAPDIEVVGNSDGRGVEGIGAAISSFKPGVVLFGTERSESRVIGAFRSIRERHPEVGLVLLSGSYSPEDARRLRELIGSTSRACAYLSKRASENVRQLSRMIHAVAAGKVIVDPVTMEVLIETAIPDRAPSRSLPIPRPGC